MAINTVLATTPQWLKFFGGRLVTEVSEAEDQTESTYGIIKDPPVGATRFTAPSLIQYLTNRNTFGNTFLAEFKAELGVILAAEQDALIVIPCGGHTSGEGFVFWLRFWDNYASTGAIDIHNTYLGLIFSAVKEIYGTSAAKIYFEIGNEDTKPTNNLGYTIHKGNPLTNSYPGANQALIPTFVEYNILPTLFAWQTWKALPGNQVSWGTMVLGSIGNGNRTVNYNWWVALLAATGTGALLPVGAIKTALTNKPMSALLEAYNTHYLWVNTPESALTWQQTVDRWESLCGSKPLFITEDVGSKQAAVGMAAASIARCLLRALHTWAGQRTFHQRKMLFWQWSEYPSLLAIEGSETASKGLETLSVLAQPDWFGPGDIVELGNVVGTPTEKPLGNVLTLFQWTGSQYEPISNDTYDAFLFAKANQSPLTQVCLFIIPRRADVGFSVGQIYMDCPFVSLPTGYVITSQRLHISRYSFDDKGQDSWAWGMPTVTVIANQFGSYAQGPKKTLRIRKQGTELPDPRNWRLGMTQNKEMVANEPLDPRLWNKQDVLCLSIQLT